MNIFFRGRATNRPTHTPYDMCAYLWGGNTCFVVRYVYNHVLRPNSLSLMHCFPPPSFPSILHSGAKITHSVHTHTPYNTIMIFRLDVHLDHFAPSAPKHGRKIEVANFTILCYLPRITRICAPTALHLIFIPPTGQHALKNFRPIHFFPN